MLHELVRRYLPEHLSQAQERSEHGFGYPVFIQRTFDDYLECGLLLYAVDTHRNTLSQAKTFGAWLVERRYCDANPWEGIRGVGRRKRGKPQLRRLEARRWLTVALGVAI